MVRAILLERTSRPWEHARGVSGVGAHPPLPVSPIQGSKGREGAGKLGLFQSSGWELGAAGMLGNGAPGGHVQNLTVSNRAVTDGDGQIAPSLGSHSHF